MNFFEKPLDALTVDDLNWLISAEVRESQETEFKRELPGDQALDTWQAGGKIGRTAIAALVKEIVAFANAQGGTLLVGIEETEDKPSRAQGLVPIRDPLGLAEILKIRIRDNIEPALYGLEAVGIKTSEKDEGVVIIRVAASPYAPHRARGILECYMRRNDHSVPMSMDEIQRRVIESSQRLQRADAWFTQQVPIINIGGPGWIMRAAARPLGPFYVPKLHRNRSARPAFQDILVKGPGQKKYNGHVWGKGLNWTPRVRGTGFEEKMDNGASFKCDVGEDGGIVIDWRWGQIAEEKAQALSLNWFIGMFGNLLLAIERLRLAAKQAIAVREPLQTTRQQ